jgi:hypothetical protein
MFALSGYQIPTIETHTTRNYSINKRMLFDENYGLASTQSLKNKDIPEGGAKGTILPSSVIFFCCFGVFLLFTQSWSAAKTLFREVHRCECVH